MSDIPKLKIVNQTPRLTWWMPMPDNMVLRIVDGLLCPVCAKQIYACDADALEAPRSFRLICGNGHNVLDFESAAGRPQ